MLLTWAGGEHLFKLGLGQLRKVQEACDCGPAHLLNRLREQTWRVDDVVEPHRWGLVGGGMDIASANKLIKQYIEDTPLLQHVLTAQAILMASLIGTADEEISGPKAQAATDSPEEKSPSPPSTSQD